MEQYKDLNKQYINGEWRDGTGQSNYMDTNPYNEEVLAEFKMAGIEDIEEAYASARKAQKEWENVNPFERSTIMENAVRIMSERRKELVELLVAESGSTHIKANVEVDFCIAITRESASFPLRMDGKMVPSLVPGKENRVYRKPLGVVGVISPFNFPMYLSMRSVAPALAVGNGVVLKPDEQTAMSGGTVIAKIFEEAGLPKGLLNVTVADIGEIGDSFVENPIPRMISFTGSTGVGRHIGALCGKNIKKVALELGGNNALVVLKDANIEHAINSAIFGKFMHNGQICMAVNRLIVHKDLYDEFVERFVEKTKSLKAGDPSEPDTLIGPLINRGAVDRILGEIEKAKSEGAKVVLEGSANGTLMTPYVLTGSNDVATAKNEMFGPVVTIIPVESEEEAITVANDTSFGLSGGVHAGSVEKGVEVAKQIQSGMVHVNDQSVNDEPLVAFGGEKDSGLGRFGGEWSLEEFTTVQWISAQTNPRKYPF
ncbi:aldehyde dehydrogenase family protein [Mesobacillus jeotgali]|jgi:acyl-CoA reductase-like NAD-dependent aldehyde dehydrogenase|uniref:Aldehyde dehydrogenase family protein n=1 Tax=Mesobacillus jeotgali TaxID=129985 RepID=A0ABY9VPH4_9BACI|nr:aldehyde dehydrogenase family protein [Mesobacillus jeotgali]WNF24565.1 aldehyde dehydrogenase family protein [Mesobacillus jeotgali]